MSQGILILEPVFQNINKCVSIIEAAELRLSNSH